ncbi:uncharacterized protein JCM15063_003010 [Sporobolomyces koalae]|uniref:uncharacterized protein n=1 Tax=Sporobolomyces koalae TaxID=500713 RepID=UPI003181AEF3
MRFLLFCSTLAIIAMCFNPVTASKKTKAVKPRTYCPRNEIACPILGSTTYDDALKQHLAKNATVQGIMAGDGGYECINVNEALDSCGGCASTGEGRDCTTIRGASGVGCAEARCVVFSCHAGWKVSMSGESCVRSRSKTTSSSIDVSNKLKRLARQHAQLHRAISS